MATYAQSSSQSWATFKEQVDEKLIKALQPKIIYNLLAKEYPATTGVVRYDDTNESWINPGLVGESAEYPGGALRFTTNYISMKDIGVAPRLPMNWVRDARFDLINEHLEEIGFGIARYLNSDILTALNTWVAGGTYNGNSYSSVTNHDVSANAVWSSTSADIVGDMSQAIAVLGADDAADGKKYVIVHPTPFQYVMTDPNFLKQINYGNADLIQRGIYPTPFGTTFLVTSQASTSYALMVNVDLAAIKYYERESLQTMLEYHPRSNHVDIVVRMRYAFACGRPKGIVKISSIA